MSDHPTPEQLRALSSGEMAEPAAGRIRAHLEGCSPCRMRVASLAIDRSRPAGEAAEPVPESLYAPAVTRAIAAVTGKRQIHLRQRAEVERLLPAVRAAGTPLELARTGLAQVGGGAPVEALLQCSFEVRHGDPGRMLMFAEQALVLVEALDPANHGHLALADLQARVRAELGNAYRVCDRLREAELALRSAQERFKEGSRPALLKARILDVLASLRVAQRRFETAHVLLDRVHAIYAAAGDRHMAGRALISRGLYATYQQRPAEALDLLMRGRALIDPRRDPKVALSAVHDSIWLLVDLGEHRLARRELLRHRRLYREDGDALNMVKLRWLEGRIAAGLGQLPRAEKLFAATRAELAAMHLPYKAALAGLELAAVLLRQAATERVFALVEEMTTTFCSLHIGREALAALLVLRDACEQKRVTLDAIQAVAGFLKSFERDPSARFEAAQPAN